MLFKKKQKQTTEDVRKHSFGHLTSPGVSLATQTSARLRGQAASGKGVVNSAESTHEHGTRWFRQSLSRHGFVDVIF